MSDGTTEPVEQETAAKRKTLSLAERIKVIDYLRSLVEPIVADSNAAVASFLRDATGVDINWPQLKYMMDELPEMKLASKMHVKSLLSTEDQLQAIYERDVATQAKILQLETKVEDLLTRLLKVDDRVLHIEANFQASE